MSHEIVAGEQESIPAVCPQTAARRGVRRWRSQKLARTPILVSLQSSIYGPTVYWHITHITGTRTRRRRGAFQCSKSLPAGISSVRDELVETNVDRSVHFVGAW